jgi:hypothetical protein
MKSDVTTALGMMELSAENYQMNRRRRLQQYINLQLITNGLPAISLGDSSPAAADAEQILGAFSERLRLVDDPRCPADRRIEAFLHDHFVDASPVGPLKLPERTLTLDRTSVARELSLPIDGNTFQSDCLHSYRVKNGVLHNPASDRRTTSGTFHVCEGGLPIPADKRATPKRAFAELFRRAFLPPMELLKLPYSANEPRPAATFVSLLIRPLVCPEVPGVVAEKRMEIRFFAPGGLVSNLDFVESIFGNVGDPFLPENDAGLDIEHWSGHTGAVILAPHLVKCKKRDLGLPHVSQATDRQRQDSMCWEDESECYNDGQAFKLTCRTAAGVIVTLIADNYFGYCKKEVKTQISYAANLYGNVEEEHAGGAIVFASHNLGEEFFAARRNNGRTLVDIVHDYPGTMDARPEGYDQHIAWESPEGLRTLPLLPGKVYMTP